jgi:hypothetical protein
VAGRRHEEWEAVVNEAMASLRAGGTATLPELLDEVRVGEIVEGISAGGDTESSLAYRRMAESLFVRTSFYETRHYLEQGDLSSALLVSRVADAVYPDHPRVCLNLARIHAGLGGLEAAFASLACYVDAPGADADTLDADPWLAPIRRDPRFQAAIARLKGGRATPPRAGDAPSPVADPARHP